MSSTAKVLSIAIIFVSWPSSSNSLPARDDDSPLDCDECIVIFENNGVCQCINSNCDPYEAGLIPAGCSQLLENDSTCVDKLSRHFAHCAPQSSVIDDIKDTVVYKDDLSCKNNHEECASSGYNDKCKENPNYSQWCCCPGNICMYTFPTLFVCKHG